MSRPPVWLIVVAFVLAIGPTRLFPRAWPLSDGVRLRHRRRNLFYRLRAGVTGWTDKLGTRWKVGWLPLGDYVPVHRRRESASQPAPNQPVADRRAFHGRPVWQRFLLVLAGPLANFLLAIIIFAAFFATVRPRRTPPVIGQIMPGSAAASSGLIVGDRITTIGAEQVDTFEDIFRYVVLRPGRRSRSTSCAVAGRSVSTFVSDRPPSATIWPDRVGPLGILQPKRVTERPTAAD